MPASGEFRLSITRALADQLGEGLARLTPASLDLESINSLQSRPGIYQLYEDEQLVYVGKAESSLPKRLVMHYRKLIGRENVGDMAFVCLYVDEDLHAVAPERLLIDRYRTAGQAPWNYAGFGNNDPGRERDTTKFEEDHFDTLHPARLDWTCDAIAPGSYTIADLLKRLKTSLPYTFRYKLAPFHKDLTVKIPRQGLTADELFQEIAEVMTTHDEQWRITALPGYVIMYPSSGPYPSARKTYP